MTSSNGSAPSETHGILAFDLYGTLVDPIAIASELDRLVPGGGGRAIAALWRQKQLEYTFRLTTMNTYRDFRWATERALGFALASLDVTVEDAQRAELIESYDHLAAFEDSAPALRQLGAAGFKLVVFSNGTPDMIGNCLANSGLGDHLAGWFSVDDVRAFKPAPNTYHHLARTLGVDVSDVRLVSCNAFDIDGARSAGLPTAWVNRAHGPFDGLDEAPATTVATLTELVDVLTGSHARS